MSRRHMAALVVFLMTAAAGTAFGQMGQGNSPGPGPNCPPNCPRAFGPQMEANYENLRLLKLFEAVDLTDEQSLKFLPIFRAYRKDMKELRQQRMDLVDRLAAAITASGDENSLRAKMDSLGANQDAIRERDEAFRREAATVLSFNQQAKLAVFQERFEREMLETLREFRQRGTTETAGKK
jgi:Spy/CpxP family protein refolding chaperone